jgi:DNA-binding MarR family transcriptional regulator
LQTLASYAPEAISAGTLKGQMPESNPDLTRLVDKLEKKRWVERKRWPGNMRKKAIRITTQGHYALNEIRPMLNMFYRQIPLEDVEILQLKTLVEKLKRNEK